MLQNEIVRIGKLLYHKNFVAAAEGNISVRLGNGKFLVTPSGLNKGWLKPQDIITVDSNGKKLSGRHKSSSELKMHLAVYKNRKDIQAVVHAHPPYATALTVTGQSLEKFFLPEAVLSLDRVPLSSYATPTTAEVPQAVSSLIRKTDAVLLRNHGVLACGKNLTDAYHKLETVEKLAQIYFLAKGMGKINYLNQSQVKNLKKIKSSLSV